ncbi:MAG TPA: DUF5668 domain-containing protein [Aggregatilineales bacterium]|nr:DUF5668 domain-containing protein [Aggregatilineales bacterium]
MNRSSIFWGLVLLLIGSLLLADNLGFLNINFWTLVWPVLLIAFGAWLFIGALRGWDRGEVERVAVPLEGAERARVIIDHGAGAAYLRGAAERGQLMAGEFAGGVEVRTSREGATQVLLMKMADGDFPGVVVPFFDGRLGWNFALNGEVPLALEVAGGAGVLNLNMRDLRVVDLKVDGGVGTSTFEMPARAGYTRARIEAGVGTVMIHIPEGVAAQIEATAGLGTITVDQNRFPAVGERRYRSANYDTAENKLDLSVEGGVGTITVR